MCHLRMGYRRVKAVARIRGKYGLGPALLSSMFGPNCEIIPGASVHEIVRGRVGDALQDAQPVVIEVRSSSRPVHP